jgi:hypothetical protein
MQTVGAMKVFSSLRAFPNAQMTSDNNRERFPECKGLWVFACIRFIQGLHQGYMQN